MSVGALGYGGMGFESATDGTSGSQSGSATITCYFPLVSESLIAQRDDLDSQNIRAQWDVDNVYNGLTRVGGTITVQGHFITLGYLMSRVFDVTTAVNTNVGLAAQSHATIRTHRFINGQTQFQSGSGSDLPTATFEINRGPIMGAGSSFIYYNCAGNTAEFTIEAGQIMRASFDFLGRSAGGIAKTTPVFPPTGAILWTQASVSVAGGGSALFESLTVRVDNALEAVPKLDGRTSPDLIKRNNFRQCQVNGRMQFQTFSEYDRFVAGSVSPMRITFTGQTTISSGYTESMIIDIPSMKYSTFPLNIGGPGHLTIDFTGRAIYHEGSGTSLAVWLVNTRTANYMTNTYQ